MDQCSLQSILWPVDMKFEQLLEWEAGKRLKNIPYWLVHCSRVWWTCLRKLIWQIDFFNQRISWTQSKPQYFFAFHWVCVCDCFLKARRIWEAKQPVRDVQKTPEVSQPWPIPPFINQFCVKLVLKCKVFSAFCALQHSQKPSHLSLLPVPYLIFGSKFEVFGWVTILGNFSMTKRSLGSATASKDLGSDGDRLQTRGPFAFWAWRVCCETWTTGYVRTEEASKPSPTSKHLLCVQFWGAAPHPTWSIHLGTTLVGPKVDLLVSHQGLPKMQLLGLQSKDGV